MSSYVASLNELLNDNRASYNEHKNVMDAAASLPHLELLITHFNVAKAYMVSLGKIDHAQSQKKTNLLKKILNDAISRAKYEGRWLNHELGTISDDAVLRGIVLRSPKKRLSKSMSRDISGAFKFNLAVTADKLLSSLYWRSKIFPVLNFFRLFIIVRASRFVRTVGDLVGKFHPTAVNIANNIKVAFSWAKYLGWIFYLPRIICNLVTAIRNTTDKKSKVTFIQALRSKKYQLANDVVWAMIGFTTCFGAAVCWQLQFLTPVLYIFDVVLGVMKNNEAIRDAKRNHAESKDGPLESYYAKKLARAKADRTVSVTCLSFMAVGMLVASVSIDRVQSFIIPKLDFLLASHHITSGLHASVLISLITAVSVAVVISASMVNFIYSKRDAIGKCYKKTSTCVNDNLLKSRHSGGNNNDDPSIRVSAGTCPVQ